MLWLIFIAILTFLYIYKHFKKPKNLPPGPKGLPIVGYLPFLGKIPYVTLNDLSKKFGNVIGITLGFRFVVIVNDYPSIKEAASKDSFLGRPPDSSVDLIKTYFPQFISGSSGNLWKEHRRFAVQTFKDTGLGKPIMEDLIKEEIEYAMSEISSKKGPVDITSIFQAIASNAVCILSFGKRFDYSDPDGIRMNECVRTILQEVGGAAIHSFFPFLLKFVIATHFGYQKFFKASSDFRQFLSEQIFQHSKTFNEGNLRDYTDRYLLMQKERLKKDPNTTYTKDMLLGNLAEFFSAGTDTTSSTMQWICLLMAVNKDIEKKVHKEIDEIIGVERQPSWNDHLRMVYTRAVLMEVQRWTSIAPLGVLRGTMEDTTLQGYHIPKDTIVLFNLWAMHHDPKYWKEPEKFDPERFIEDGKLNTKLESYGPFSLGRRSCPGEILAHLELFLVFTSFMQKYRFELPDDVNPNEIDLNPIDPMGITLQPKQTKFYLIERNKN